VVPVPAPLELPEDEPALEPEELPEVAPELLPDAPAPELLPDEAAPDPLPVLVPEPPPASGGLLLQPSRTIAASESALITLTALIRIIISS
jgi:hypothetical protein